MSSHKRPVEKPIGGFDPAPSTVISTFFGSGFFPIAPATFASLIVALILWVLPTPPFLARLGLLVGVTLVGIWSAGRTERRYGTEDPRCVVIDEVAGMLVATIWVPWDAIHLLIAFLLFRILDVFKPPPGYQVESYGGGLGIMADDLVAGAYSLILLLLLGLVLPVL